MIPSKMTSTVVARAGLSRRRFVTATLSNWRVCPIILNHYKGSPSSLSSSSPHSFYSSDTINHGWEGRNQSFIQRISFSTRSEDAAQRLTVVGNIITDKNEEDGTKGKVGAVTRELKKLDAVVLKKIIAEVKEIDVNSDGLIDADEMAELFKRHRSTFTDEEIVEFTELFYTGKAGGGIPVPEFVETLDAIALGKQHPILDGNCSSEFIYRKTHHSYTQEELDIELTHEEPKTALDKAAYRAVKLVRSGFDLATGWKNDNITKDKILNRVIFLETIAAVPGMVAAVTRHMKSLRKMERDGGLMQLFLEEANNERMHLLSFIKLKNPGKIFRSAVLVSQFGFGTLFFIAYTLSPKFCHRFVGYVEEEACSTYTKIVKAIEASPPGSDLSAWKMERAPKIAIGYWKLGESGTVLDLMYAVRADEAEHRDVNHTMSDLHTNNNSKVLNPYNDPEIKVNSLLRKYVRDMMASNTEEDFIVNEKPTPSSGNA